MKNRKQRAEGRGYNYVKWKNSPKKSARIKQMIFDVAKPCDDEFWPYPILPWNEHPFAYWQPQSTTQRDARILRRVKRIVGEKAFEDILSYIEECEGGSDYDITFNTGGGHLQSEDFGFVERAYVSQSCGYSGDDYSGNIWIPITPKRYLRFYFSC
ncbi:hypothetical protein NVP1151O_64 [Vibrio phage 1.151.O._10N.222.46.B1]|nr:hypothetical protein NVP1151O_64 [Vibrio phage 1.151.O._10N.222.46.B1]